MVPVIALVGRPNVGKSTLFNRLTRTRDAIVGDLSGLTRDRQYGEAKWQGRSYILVDTGGISGDEHGMDEKMAEQSLLAIEEADVVLFLVDAKAGFTAADQMIGEHLRKRNKRSYVVANKVDNIDPELARAEFAPLGMGHAIPIAGAHGRGITQMLEIALSDFPKDPEEEEEGEAEVVLEGQEAKRIPGPSEKDGIKIAIIGRPNVGKSTLVNRMLGEDRVIVYDEPGTTRDSIYIPFERNDEKYTLIDTAGVRKRGKIHEEVEKFSVVKTLQAIKDANVVIFVMDAREGVVDHDLNLLGFALEAGRALVIAINKWDGMTPSEREFVKVELTRRLFFVDFADIHFISALHGTGVGVFWERLLALVPPLPTGAAMQQQLRLAVVGRPNVGKSSIVNALLGDERMIVSDVPGTTRDAVDSRLRWHGQEVLLIDTAGLRRKTKVKRRLEVYSNLRSLSAIDNANVVLMTLDASRSFAEQDLRIAKHAHEEGKGVIIVVNKWDLVEKDNSSTGEYVLRVREALPFLGYHPIFFF
ncbi:MAG: ribosome biogenesis GTPase Der, partial [Pseudomonadales bacterium]|nr:ribosome biogenesis GTPase Der [Pseudomonadales bacterium]